MGDAILLDLLALPLFLLLGGLLSLLGCAGIPLLVYSSLVWVPFLQRRLYHSTTLYGQFLAVLLVPIPGCVSLWFGQWICDEVADFDFSWVALVSEYSGRTAWLLLEAVWLLSMVELGIWAVLERRFERPHNLSAPEEKWPNTQTRHRLLRLALVSVVLATYLASYTTLAGAVASGNVLLAERRLRFNLEGAGLDDGDANEPSSSIHFRGPLLPTALFNHDKDMALLLMKHGADKDFNRIRYLTPLEGDEESTFLVLEIPIQRNDREMVEFMLDQGANVNAQVDGYTPLHAAAAHGTAEIVELLIQRGANLSAQTSNGESPLDIAKTSKNREATNELLRHVGDDRL